MKLKFAKFKILVLAMFLSAVALQAEDALAQACTHYASPSGTGIGTSPNNPFKIANFWPLAKPGYTLCLLDGQYTGAASMIRPPQNLRGTASARITIKALNDGKVTLNGQYLNEPVKLYNNDYFVLEGFNAHSSKVSVVHMYASHNNIVRRVAGWDAADGNTNIFGVHGSTNNLLEDVAGWGIARKIFSFSQGGNKTTVRRAWGRWEGSHVVGPKMTFTLAYNNYHIICENCIGTWSGERMERTHTLLNYSGTAWTGAGAGTYTDYEVNQAYGIFAIDRNTSDKNINTKLLGSIAYVQAKDRFHPNSAVLISKLDSVEVANTVVYVEPGSHATKKTFILSGLPTSLGGPAQNLTARNLTGVGGAGAYIDSEWQGENRVQGANIGSVPSIFGAPGNGARVCYRYKNGVLTNEALWPWPMNQRILEATTKSGHTPVNVTATIEKLFGSIPASCKGGSSGTSSNPTAGVLPPSAPISLQTNYQ